MDWKRAKNILIVMFLIINIFLSYQLYTISRSQYKYTDKAQLERVVAYLESKNIHLETEIPDRVLIIPPLSVKYQQFEENALKKQFFPSGNTQLSQNTDGFVLKNGEQSLTIKSNIYLSYSNDAIKVKQEDVNEKKCIRAANLFLSKLQLGNSKYVKLQEHQKGYVRLILGQQYKNIPIKGSQIEIIATEEGVVSAEIHWFETIRPEKSYNLTTPVVALLTAYEKRGKDDAPVTINEIRQGYYFNSTVQGDSGVTIALEGAVTPMWVIKSGSNEIYVNAYNEEIENVK